MKLSTHSAHWMRTSKRTNIFLSFLFAHFNFNGKNVVIFQISNFCWQSSHENHSTDIMYWSLNSNWTQQADAALIDKEITIKIQVKLKHLAKIVRVRINFNLLRGRTHTHNNSKYYYFSVIFVNWTSKIPYLLFLFVYFHYYYYYYRYVQFSCSVWFC